MWPFTSSALKVAEYSRSRTPQEPAEFVRACALPDDPNRTSIALAVRDAIAELGEIDPLLVRADDSFDRDLVNLPFWGSLDTIAVILALEKHLKTKISDDDAHSIRNPEMSHGMVVADFVRDVFQVVNTK